MAIEITTVEVFERALDLPVAERRQLVTQLLVSLERVSDATTAEQISASFQALDARFVAVTRTLKTDDDEDERFGARLA
jgi:hypothetical protein